MKEDNLNNENLKVGDRVEVVELESCDEGIIVIGNFGIIKELGATDTNRKFDVFYIKLDKDISEFNEIKYANINKDGTYQIFRYQLKLIKED